MKYLKFKSITFWSGVALALIPLLKAFGVEIPHSEAIITAVTGTGLVGLRKAIG